VFGRSPILLFSALSAVSAPRRFVLHSAPRQSSRADASRAAGPRHRWIGEGKLSPAIDAALPFTHAAEALERIEKRQVKGKLVLVPGG